MHQYGFRDNFMHFIGRWFVAPSSSKLFCDIGSSIKVHNVSSVIVNGQLQPRIDAIFGYAALLDTITAENEREEEEEEESKKEKIRNYRHRRGQLYCFFCE